MKDINLKENIDKIKDELDNIVLKFVDLKLDNKKENTDCKMIIAKLNSIEEINNKLVNELVKIYKRNPRKFKRIYYLLKDFAEIEKEIYKKNGINLIN